MPTGTMTITGILISLAPLVANAMGYSVTPGFDETVTDLVAGAIQVVGAIVALYGRARAKGPLFLKHS